MHGVGQPSSRHGSCGREALPASFGHMPAVCALPDCSAASFRGIMKLTSGTKDRQQTAAARALGLAA